MNRSFVAVFTMLCAALVGCSAAGQSAPSKLPYSELYSDPSGVAATRSYDIQTGDLIWVSYIGVNPETPTALQSQIPGARSLSNGDWVVVPSAPCGLVDLQKVIVLDNGNPTEAFRPYSNSISSQIITAQSVLEGH